VADAARNHFREINRGVLDDPRVKIVFDDARHFLATTDETFDIITAGPIHPWVRGAGSVYTREFFELSRRRLNPGGISGSWVPLASYSLAAVKSEMATIRLVFPNAGVWHTGNIDGQRNLMVMARADASSPIDIERIVERERNNPELTELVRELDYPSTLDMLANYVGTLDDLDAFIGDAPINRDWNPTLEYLAGQTFHVSRTEELFAAIGEHRGRPTDLFEGPPQLMARFVGWSDAAIEGSGEIRVQ
jgi:spermidine synthase